MKPMKLPNLNETAGQATDIERLTKASSDPRIKSPDEILAKLAAAKKAAAAPQAAAPATDLDAPLGEPVLEAPKPADSDRTLALAKELADLRARYDQEIAQWREYERRIQDWRAQVVGIVQGLKRDAVTRQELTDELNRCRALLKAREDELQRVRGAGRPNFKAAV